MPSVCCAGGDPMTRFIRWLSRNRNVDELLKPHVLLCTPMPRLTSLLPWTTTITMTTFASISVCPVKPGTEIQRCSGRDANHSYAFCFELNPADGPGCSGNDAHDACNESDPWLPLQDGRICCQLYDTSRPVLRFSKSQRTGPCCVSATLSQAAKTEPACSSKICHALNSDVNRCY